MKMTFMEKIYYCLVCHNTIQNTTRLGRPRTVCEKPQCIQKNRLERYTRWKERVIKGLHKIRPSKKWIEESIQKIRQHRVRYHDEDWIPQQDALRVAGLKHFCSLLWIRNYGVLTIRKDPYKKWRKKSLILYAKSQMEIIRMVREGLGLIEKP